MNDQTGGEQQQLPPYVIEAARSGRSKCKTCRRAIPKGTLRFGFLIEGPYGVGYLWHHMACAARRHFERLEEAYEMEAWKEAKEPPGKVPPLEKLKEQREKAEEKKKTRKEIPYVEIAPSGRSSCKHCGELIEKGAIRVALGREVTFGNQTRTTAINVHPWCVHAALDAEDCSTERDGLEGALRENSREVSPEQIATAVTDINGGVAS